MSVKTEIFRIGEAVMAGCAFYAFGYVAAIPNANIFAGLGVATLCCICFVLFSTARDSEIFERANEVAQNTMDKARYMIANALEIQKRAQSIEPIANMPEVTQILRENIASSLHKMAALAREIEAQTGDLLNDHLDAHDAREHAEAHRRRLEGIIGRAEEARRVLEMDPGPEPIAPVSRVKVFSTMPASTPEGMRAANDALARLETELTNQEGPTHE